MKNFLVYVSMAMVISFSLLGLAIYAVFRKKDHKDLTGIGPNHFDVPIWQGKVKEVVYGEHRHQADLDVIVYSQSIFFGFAHQAFPFVNINADEMIRVQYQRHSVSIQIKGKAGEPSSYVTVRGASEKELHQFAKKAEFICSRAKKKG